MIPELVYLRPKTVEEALQIIDTANGKARLIAGGTDIIPGLQQQSNRFKDIKVLVDTKSIIGLKDITFDDENIIIGSACTFSEIQNSAEIKKHLPLLVKAASTIGSLQIRNLATIIGNFVNNAPCADSVPPLLVYNTKIEIQSFNSKRQLELQDFLLAPYKNQLQAGEIVAKIIVPKITAKMKGDFFKLGRRRAVSISRITLAVLADIKNDIIDEIRIASGAVTPIGKRFYELEKSAQGKHISDSLFKELATGLGEKILHETGLRWSSAYKLPVVQQKLYHLLTEISKS